MKRTTSHINAIRCDARGAALPAPLTAHSLDRGSGDGNGPERHAHGTEDDDSRSGRVPHGWFRMYAMVLEFLAYIAVLGYLGSWLDERRGWEPWGVMSGLILGTALGVYRMIRESKRLGL